jgi:hypothetical protein
MSLAPALQSIISQDGVNRDVLSMCIASNNPDKAANWDEFHTGSFYMLGSWDYHKRELTRMKSECQITLRCEFKFITILALSRSTRTHNALRNPHLLLLLLDI